MPFAKKITLLFLFFLSLRLCAQYKATDLSGEWMVESKDAIIKIQQKGTIFYGTIAWLKNPNDKTTGKLKTDIKNPEPALRSKPILGSTLLKDFIFDGDDEWEDGTIYDARSGKTYKCIITMLDINTIKAKGYVGISLFGVSTTWTRVRK